MATDAAEVTHDFPGFFKVYKDGRIERYWHTDHVPAGLDPETGVQSKDIEISAETGVKVRIFLPRIDGSGEKLTLLVHYHGGGFCIGSPFASAFKTFLSFLVTQANIIAISIDYRLAPEHLLPIAYEDSLAGLQWVAKHVNGQGPEPWINEHADLGRVILAGESAGANLAHYVAVQAGASGLFGVKINKLLIVHPYFGGKQPDKIYEYMCPTSPGPENDPKLNPDADPNLMKLKCDKLLVCVAEKDMLRGRGVAYYEKMSKCAWGGDVEFYETKEEGHCFHFFNPSSENIQPFMKKLVNFIKQQH
uniref:Alpha/beta hydrolase fold-3 domain-containing protein n=1 Tax=Rhizophora mucronata TaxID=61149 RepID=A0A2P2JEI9_RHIMU